MVKTRLTAVANGTARCSNQRFGWWLANTNVFQYSQNQGAGVSEKLADNPAGKR